MKNLIFTAFTFIALILSGCTASYNYDNMRPSQKSLDTDKAVLISIPENGRYTNTHYPKSGKQTATALAYAVSAYGTNDVTITDDCRGLSCLTSANSQKYGYYIEPIIMHWEDRATEWSGRRDRIQIGIKVYDLATKEELDNSDFVASSKSASFGGDHPQDLLAEPFKRYINQLYR